MEQIGRQLAGVSIAPPELVARIAARARHPRCHDAQDAGRCAEADREASAGRDAQEVHMAARGGGIESAGAERRDGQHDRCAANGAEFGKRRVPAEKKPHVVARGLKSLGTLKRETRSRCLINIRVQ